MQSLFKLCNAMYWLALAVWLAVLVTAGVSAIAVFTTLGEMDVSLSAYAAFEPDESDVPNAHAHLAAGHVLEPVFTLVDFVQFAMIPLMLITLVAQFTVFKQKIRRPANLIRTGCIVIAAGLFAFHALGRAPQMNRDLHAYWKAAQLGDLTTALEHRAAFNRRHPTAEAVLNATFLLVVVATFASAVAMTPALPERRTSELQTPHLARKR